MIATIYTTTTCAYCTMVKKYLTSKGIEYVEKDASTPELRDEAYKLSGVLSVPITVINDVVIRGWNVGELNRAIADS